MTLLRAASGSLRLHATATALDEQQVWPAPARALPHPPPQASVIRLSSDPRASELTAYYFHRRRQMPVRPSARPTTMFLARRLA
jgi:hypothetical protein